MPLSTSIALCTCNGARFLEAQWSSLLAQSRLPDEIVVRDDASTDMTPVLLESLCRRASEHGVRVRFTRNPRNLGYVANFEAALRDATGDIVFLCDQDDVWHRDKLALLASEFERRADLLLVCGDARRVDDDGAPLRRSLFEVLKVSRDEIERMHVGQGFNILLRRSLATGATVALRRTLLADALPFPAGWVHDEWLAIIAAALGGFDCIEQPLIDYRQHADNQIGMPDRKILDKWRDMRRPRHVLLGELIARAEVLDTRLRRVPREKGQAINHDLSEALAHWRVRRDLHGAPWRRVGAITREALSGRYRRFGTGWRSVLRDLLRRD